MNRRGFVLGVGIAALGVSTPGGARHDDRIYRIGFLEAGTASANQHFLVAFRTGLAALGYRVGRNLVIDQRWADGRVDRFPVLLAELIALQPDVLVVASHVGALAARSATRSVPVVFVGASDPVGQGLVGSMARPGGNVTGLSRAVEDGTLGKAVQILKEIAPSATRVAVLWNPAARIEPRRREVDAAARALGMTPLWVEIRDRVGFDQAFADMRRRRADALVVIGDPFTLSNRAMIVELAATGRLPAVYEFAEFARAGGLVAYAPDTADLFRRAARYVDRILEGASAGELPVEQPIRYELVINMKSALAQKLTVPESLLLRADEVIR